MAADDVYPLRHRPPGRPMASGFDVLPEAEQEKFRRQHVEMMRRLAPIFREMDDCRGRAAVSARTAWVG